MTAVRTQPKLWASRTGAVRRRKCFEYRNGVHGRRRRDPLVAAAVVSGLALEDRTHDHGKALIAGRLWGRKRLHAARLQMENLACPRPNEIDDDDEARRVEHVEKVREIG